MKSLAYILFMILTGVSLNSNAQEGKVAMSITAGYALKFADAGAGWHGGFNFYSKKPKRLKLDIQLSVNNTIEKESRISYFAANPLAGVRYYLLDPHKTAKVFCNAVVGSAFVLDSDDDVWEFVPAFGYSAGIFVNNNGLLTGVSIESYQNVIFKVGYAF